MTLMWWSHDEDRPCVGEGDLKRWRGGLGGGESPARARPPRPPLRNVGLTRWCGLVRVMMMVTMMMIWGRPHARGKGTSHQWASWRPRAVGWGPPETSSF